MKVCSQQSHGISCPGNPESPRRCSNRVDVLPFDLLVGLLHNCHLKEISVLVRACVCACARVWVCACSCVLVRAGVNTRARAGTCLHVRLRTHVRARVYAAHAGVRAR